jgi:hypothetical protein
VPGTTTRATEVTDPEPLWPKKPARAA